MGDSVKGNVGSFVPTTCLSRAGDETKALKIISNSVDVLLVETDVIDFNKEIGLHEFSRGAARTYLALVRAIDYLRVRRN